MIEEFQNFFEQKFGLKVKFGAELEFYLRSDNQSNVDLILDELATKCLRIENEKGWQQYECVFDYNDSAAVLAQKINEVRTLTQFLARRTDCQASFEAKPYNDDYGSALHVHVSLHNNNGQNLFENTEIDENAFIGKVIAGILDITPESVYLLCRKQKDFLRFVSSYMAPTHISWGGNNRTTILRIPDSEPLSRRVEFRLAAASSDPAAVIFVLYIGLLHGLSQRVKLPDRIHGNSYDEQYNLVPLPKTLLEAKDVFERGGKIKYYMNKISPNLIPEFEL